MAEAMYVRVHPYEPKRGFKVRIFVAFGQKFEAEKGWYRVSPVLAEKLKEFKQNAYDPDSKPVFQISDQAGAKKIAIEDYEKANPQIQIERAVDGAQTIDEEDLELPAEDDYDTTLKSDLLELAETRGLEVSSAMKKSDIVELLRANDTGGGESKGKEEIPFD